LEPFYHDAPGDDRQIGSQRAFAAKPSKEGEIPIEDGAENLGYELISSGFIDLHLEREGRLRNNVSDQCSKSLAKRSPRSVVSLEAIPHQISV
jgi:hypothetical protein